VVAVKYEDLSAAFDFVSSAAPMEHQAYISIDTGTIYWISELNPLEEEVPEDLETSDRYIAIPHKNDLDLGRDLPSDSLRRNCRIGTTWWRSSFGIVAPMPDSRNSSHQRAVWRNGTHSRANLPSEHYETGARQTTSA
jgi:hypothetical protein